MKDLSSAWNVLYERFLGIRPKNDAEGVLQDVHWSTGAFGYFPSYTLGNILCAQLWECLEHEIPSVKNKIRLGEYGSILKWLREKVHCLGARYSAVELVKKVTGENLSEKPLLKYLNRKYCQS